jgi:hypothetical protein
MQPFALRNVKAAPAENMPHDDPRVLVLGSGLAKRHSINSTSTKKYGYARPDPVAVVR